VTPAAGPVNHTRAASRTRGPGATRSPRPHTSIAHYSSAEAVPIITPNQQRPCIMNDRKTISIMKACELDGVSRRTIYNWIASGKVEYIRTAGGSVRIFVDTLWRQPARTDLTSKEAS
jgi:excisionase family DNA binding protein